MDRIQHQSRFWLVAGALILGAVVRLILLPSPGTPDVDTWKTWAYAGRVDTTGKYGVGGTPPERRLLERHGEVATTEYPPLSLYEMGAVGRVYAAIDPPFSDTPTLSALIKLPGLLAELAFVIAMLTWGTRHLGREPATWIALAFWLNPAIVINGAALGYLDAQMAVPAVLALLAAMSGAPLAAGALIATALMTKTQPLFVAPVIGLAVLTSARVRGAAVGFAAGGVLTFGLLLLPILVRGAWANMVQALARLGAHDMVSGQALNVWWVVTWIVRSLDSLDLGWNRAFTLPVKILGIERFMEVGYPNPKPIGVVIVASAIGWALWRSRRGLSLGGWALVAAWCVYGYAMFNAQVHENHFYLAVPFLAVAAGVDRSQRGLFFAASAMAAFNMYVFYNLGPGWGWDIDRGWTGVDITVPAAIVNIGVFVWMTRRMWRETEKRPAVLA